MISLITRIQNTDLYHRMLGSAMSRSAGPVEALSETDEAGQPKIAETYNRLSKSMQFDIAVFCHDDTVFLSDAWDTALVKTFQKTGADIIGVVGSKKYSGGNALADGRPHIAGKYVSLENDRPVLKVCSADKSGPVRVVDGLLMAVRADFLKGHPFDEKLGGLFFYDTDLCLRSDKVFLADLLIGHGKPPGMVGKYPKDLAPMSAFEPYFYAKHGLPGPVDADMKCVLADPAELGRLTQEQIYSALDLATQSVPGLERAAA